MDAIEAYFTNLSRLLEKTLRSQRNAMEESARRIANAIRNGGMVYTFGTGHGHLLALEVFYRAGGLACVCPMLEEALMLHRSAAGSSLQERDDRMVLRWVSGPPCRRVSNGLNDPILQRSSRNFRRLPNRSGTNETRNCKRY